MAVNIPAQKEQKAVAINPSMKCVFFQSQALVYNYGTDQWTRIPVVASKRFFSVEDQDRVLGTIETSGTSVMIQDSDLTASTAATITMTTADFELEPGFQSVVDGCRPITNGGSLQSIRIGVRDILSDTVSFATGTSLDTRTGFSGFRGGANPPTGAYHRAEFVFTGGLTTVSGAYFEFFRSGRV
jgi:hypothetical protein